MPQTNSVQGASIAPDWRESGFLLAVLAIVIIALFVEFYPPVGWGLAILAVMAMVGTYYSR